MVSPMEMPSSKNGSDARLTGSDINAYTKAFADKFLSDKIQYGVEVTGLRRAATGTGWSVDILHTASSTNETRDYSRVVMCTGVRFLLLRCPNAPHAHALGLQYTGDTW